MKRKRESRREYLVAVAAIAFALLVVQVALAQDGGGPDARASAGVRQQLAKLKAQIRQLRTQVQSISNRPGGPAGGGLTGNYPNPGIAANAIASNEILNGSVTAADLGANSVGTSEIFDGSVTADKLATVPTARVRRTTSQTINSGSVTDVSFTTETWDTANLHTTNSPTLDAPVTGVYLITGSVIFQGGSSVGFRELQLNVNNTKPIADSQQDPQTSATDFLNASTVYRLNAGDNVRMKVQQTSGGNLTVIASSGGAETSPELSMTWLGPA